MHIQLLRSSGFGISKAITIVVREEIVEYIQKKDEFMAYKVIK